MNRAALLVMALCLLFPAPLSPRVDSGSRLRPPPRPLIETSSPRDVSCRPARSPLDDCPCGDEALHRAVRELEEWLEWQVEKVRDATYGPPLPADPRGIAPVVTGEVPDPPDRAFLDPGGNEIPASTVAGLLMVRDAYVAALRAMAARFRQIAQSGLADQRERVRELTDAAQEMRDLDHERRRRSGRVRHLQGLITSLEREADTHPYPRERAEFQRQAEGRRAELARALQELEEIHREIEALGRRYPELFARTDDGMLWETFVDEARGEGESLDETLEAELERTREMRESLLATAAAMEDAAVEAIDKRRVEDLWVYGSDRFRSIREDLAGQHPLFESLTEQVEKQFEAQSIHEAVDEGGEALVLMPVFAVAVVVAPWMGCLGIVAYDVVVEGNEVVVTYMNEEEARNAAAVTGRRPVMIAEAEADAAKVRVVGVVILGAIDVGGVTASTRIRVRSLRGRPCPEPETPRVATGDDPPTELLPSGEPPRAQGEPVPRDRTAPGAPGSETGLRPEDAEFWTERERLHRERLRSNGIDAPDEIAEKLERLDEAVREAERAGIPRERIDEALDRVRRGPASVSSGADSPLDAATKDLRIMTVLEEAVERGVTILVREEDVPFLRRFLGNREVKVVVLEPADANRVVAKAATPEGRLTAEEKVLARDLLHGEGEVYVFDPEQLEGGLYRVLDEDDAANLGRALERPDVEPPLAGAGEPDESPPGPSPGNFDPEADTSLGPGRRTERVTPEEVEAEFREAETRRDFEDAEPDPEAETVLTRPRDEPRSRTDARAGDDADPDFGSGEVTEEIENAGARARALEVDPRVAADQMLVNKVVDRNDLVEFVEGRGGDAGRRVPDYSPEELRRIEELARDPDSFEGPLGLSRKQRRAVRNEARRLGLLEGGAVPLRRPRIVYEGVDDDILAKAVDEANGADVEWTQAEAQRLRELYEDPDAFDRVTGEALTPAERAAVEKVARSRGLDRPAGRDDRVLLKARLEARNGPGSVEWTPEERVRLEELSRNPERFTSANPDRNAPESRRLSPEEIRTLERAAGRGSSDIAGGRGGEVDPGIEYRPPPRGAVSEPGDDVLANLPPRQRDRLRALWIKRDAEDLTAEESREIGALLDLARRRREIGPPTAERGARAEETEEKVIPGSRPLGAVPPITYRIRRLAREMERPMTAPGALGARLFGFAVPAEANPPGLGSAPRDPSVQRIVIEVRDGTRSPGDGNDASDRAVPGGALLPSPRDSDLRVLVTGLGGLGGDAASMRIFQRAGLPVDLSGGSLVVEPVDLAEEAKERLIEQLHDWAGKDPVTARFDAYCLEFLRRPPAAGTVFRIASQELQQRYAPLRSVLDAGRRLYETGLLNPDSDPEEYFHSIRQWAIWSLEEELDGAGFEAAFLKHTRENAEKLGEDWTEGLEEAVRALVPNRWRDVSNVLEEARRALEDRGPAVDPAAEEPPPPAQP